MKNNTLDRTPLAWMPFVVMATIPVTRNDLKVLWMITCIGDTMSRGYDCTRCDQRTSALVQEATVIDTLLQVDGPRELSKVDRATEMFLDTLVFV